MKRVLITGNEGFIGKNLENYLQERDYITDGVDTLSDQDVRTFRIRDTYDAVVHLAALNGIETCENNSDLAYETNVNGTLNMLKETYKRSSSAKFIFASSASVYGNNPNDNIVNPSGIYAVSKFNAEKQCKAFGKKGLNTFVLRFFNVYGQGQTKGLIGNINNLKQGESLFIKGTGNNKRDYVHVDDVCEAIRLSIDSNIILRNIAIDIGTGNSYSINDVVRIANRYKQFNTVNEIFGDSGTLVSEADISSAKKFLNWESKIKLNKELETLLK